MDATASRMHEIESTAVIRQRMLDAKRAAGTSVVFGFDAMHYETDAQSRQKDILMAEKKEFVDGKAMKKALTRTNFVLGNDSLDYVTNQMAQEQKCKECKDAGGDAYEKLAGPSTRQSSCYFGSDAVSYRTTAHDSMALSANALRDQGDNSNMRAHARKLKGELSGHNFSFGNDVCTYKTTANDAFRFEEKSAANARGRLAGDQMSDLRREHFNFGTEQVIYETDTMRSMKGSGVTPGRVAEMREDAVAAEALKRKLRTTSFVIGDDPLYY